MSDKLVDADFEEIDGPAQYLFYKAQPVFKGREVTSVCLVFEEEFPDMPSLEGARERHAFDASRLEDILIRTLPGGTYDALLVEMMRRKVSLFHVAHVTEEDMK